MGKLLKRQPKTERARHTKDVIIKATAQIILKDGVDAVSTNKIAEVAGVSIGSLYQYYTNKDEILAEMLEDIIKRREANVRSALDITVAFGSLEDATVKVIDAIFTTNSQEDAKLEFALLPLILQQGPNNRFIIIAQNMQSLMTPILKALLMVKNPKIAARDLDTMIFVLIQTLRANLLASTLPFGSKINRERLKKELTRLIVSYLQA